MSEIGPKIIEAAAQNVFWRHFPLAKWELSNDRTRAEYLKNAAAHLDAALKAGLREQIRAEAIREAAEVCRSHWWARDIDWWMAATKKDVSQVAAEEFSAAILAILDKPLSVVTSTEQKES
jgi:hypothetical protein